jgi:DNA-binding GntR family transcriptional regulator
LAKIKTIKKTRGGLPAPTKLAVKGGQIQRSAGLVDEVYARIRADIMSLKIPPDTRITVDNLVRELGVSQTPIREALSMLEATGLVTKQYFIGYCTAPKLNRKQFEELYEIRLLIEPFAAARATERMSDEELNQLDAFASGMRPKGASETRASYDLFADLDSELHERIAQGSGNALIAESLARLHTHLHIFRLRFHNKIAAQAHGEHAQLIGAMQARDAAGAQAAMRAHIKNSYDRFRQFTDD